MEIAIIKNEEENSHIRWARSCDKEGLKYDIIDITRNNWLEAVVSKPYDIFLLKPPGEIQKFKNLFDERIYILAKVMRKNLFPAYEEVILHENKKLLSYFLEATQLPHPKTHIFYYKDEAKHFVKSTVFPVVAKTSIGASASGVEILHNFSEANAYLNKAFSIWGVRRRFGPNRVTGSPKKWASKTIKDYSYFKKKIRYYLEVVKDAQRGFVIFQEYIPHEFEWRAVRIGDSFFAHKKIKYGEKASGSKGIDYVEPPVKLLDFLKQITDKFGYTNMALDLFENVNGKYLINEMQTIFGHVQDYICAVDGISGRYIHTDGIWSFDPGDFNSNESYDLRLEYALRFFRQ